MGRPYYGHSTIGNNVEILLGIRPSIAIRTDGNAAHYMYRVVRDIFIRGGGGRGALSPLDNPKRSKIWYVACGTIIRRVAAAAK